MLLLGSHVSFTKDRQLLGSLEEALLYGSTTFMFYTGAPQNSLRYPISDELTLLALEKMKDTDIDYQKVVVHAPYIINLANPDADKYAFSVRFLMEEILRCEKLGIKSLILHPGSHVNTTLDSGIFHVTKALNQILLDKTSCVSILIETMAGKGTEVGKNLEEVKLIIEKIENKERVGVCIDTCHLNDAGYSLENFDQFLDDFDKIIGLKYLKCIHINDSKNEQGAKKDRHENIGFGAIGFDILNKIVHHDKLKDVPKILETPYIDKKYPPYKKEIEMLKLGIFNEKLMKEITTD